MAVEANPERRCARIVGSCDTRLWGLSSLERLRRMLAGEGIVDVADASQAVPADHSVLLLRADFLYEQRTLHDLTARCPILLTRREATVAAHVPAALAAATIAHLADAAAPAPAGVARESVAGLSGAYSRKLRKSQPPVVLPIQAAHQDALERHLFDGAYKGITDLVTKFAWPAPARVVVRWCTQAGIPPNIVTGASLVLAFAVMYLFVQGHFWLGLLLGWIMTFLDTVDGKLARVTIQSTSLGHALDKGIDLITPPIWYICWGLGLGAAGPGEEALLTTFAYILGGYIAGRLVEGCFDWFLDDMAVFTWRKLDAYVRLIIARRNPNLILLTAFLAVGQPAAGLDAVAAWTVWCTVFLLIRLAQAAFERAIKGPLESWLSRVDDDADADDLAVRLFARRPLPPGLDG